MENKAVIVIFLIMLVFTASCKQAVKKQDITSFEECVKAGYPVGESYPRQCFVPGPNGKTFVEELKETPEVETTGDPAVNAVGKDLGNVDSVEKDLGADELGDLDSGLADVQNI